MLCVGVAWKLQCGRSKCPCGTLTEDMTLLPATDSAAVEAKVGEALSLESKTDCKLVIVEGTSWRCCTRSFGTSHDHTPCGPPGNISAGKSTLCRSLANDLGFVLYLEPTVRGLPEELVWCHFP